MEKQILLEIRAIAGDARRELAALARDLGFVGATKAEAKANVNTTQAFAVLAELRKQLRSLDGSKVDINTTIEIAKTLAEIEALKQQISSVSGKEIDIKVRQDIISRIGALTNRVHSLTGSFHEVENEGSKADRFLARFGRAGAGSRAFSQIARNIGDIVRFIPVFGVLLSEAGQSALVFGRNASSAFFSVISSLAAIGIAVVGLVVALNYLLALFSALIGIIATLVASLALAAGGFAALAVGVAGALGPALIVLIFLFQRFNAVMQARTAHENALKQATRERADAELKSIQTTERLHSAQKAVDDATRGVGDARAQVQDAFTQGMREMQDAALGVKDALLGVQDAELGIAESRLGVREAEFELKKFRHEARLAGTDWADLLKKAEDVDFNPERLRGLLKTTRTRGGKDLDEEHQLRLERLLLNVRRAKLDEKGATNTLEHSVVTLNRARQLNNTYINRGIRAYKPYIAALRNARDANDRLKEALHDQRNVQREIRIEAGQNTTAMTEYLRQRGKLTKAEQTFLDNLNKVFGKLKDFARLFTDPIFRAANSFFDGLSGGAQGFKNDLRDVGRAFGDSLRGLGKFLTEPATRNAFHVMARGAGALVRNLGGRALPDFLRILRNLAEAVMPNVIKKSGSIANTFHRWAIGTSNIRALRRRLQPLIKEFDTWWDIIKLLAQDFILFVQDAEKPAHRLSETIKGWLEDLKKFLGDKKNKDKVLKWLNDSWKTARDFWHAVKTIVHWVNALGDAVNAVAGPVGKFFSAVADSAGKIVEGVKAFGHIALGGGPGRHQSGGPTGTGGLSITHPGEYVIRSAVVSRLGMPFMESLNRGTLNPAFAGSASQGPSHGGVHIDTVEVNSPDGGYPDGRHAATSLAQELRRIGG